MVQAGASNEAEDLMNCDGQRNFGRVEAVARTLPADWNDTARHKAVVPPLLRSAADK